MGIIRVSRGFYGRGASETYEQPGADAVEHWLVQVDDKYFGPVQILRSGDNRLPRPMSRHPDPAGQHLICVGRACEQHAEARSPFWYLVTANYASGVEPERNPTRRRPRVTIRGVDNLVPGLTDAKGRPFTNTAGEFFSEPIETNRAGLVIRCEFSVETIPDYVLTLPGKINNSPLAVRRIKSRLARGTVRVTDWDISDLIEDDELGISYFDIAVELTYLPQGWKKLILNRGFSELVEVSYKSKKTGKTLKKKVPRLIQVGGQNATEPQWLDADGGHLVRPDPRTATLEEIRNFMKAIVVLEFDQYVEADLSKVPVQG